MKIYLSSYAPKCLFLEKEKIFNNLSKIVVQLITIAASSMIPKTEAISFVECIDNCNSHQNVHEIAKLTCYALCFFFAKG